MTYLGETVVALGLTVALLTKAALERWHFQDRDSAKHTLFIFAVSVTPLCVAIGFSLFINYIA